MLAGGMRRSVTRTGRGRTFLVALAFAFTCTLSPSSARAGEDAPWLAQKGGYMQLFATSMVGSGLRFNNPYRLATPLGDSAESVSRTATYVDLGIAATLGNPLGFQHGLALRASIALEGVPQTVLTPSYLLYRRFTPFALFGRAGLPVVMTPTRTVGLEASAGAVLFVRGGIGVVGEVVGDLFYGAGTRERATPTYPVLSGQLGLLIAYEVLP